MASIFQGDFERDEAKARLNLKHHGVSFEEAASVFDDPLGVPYVDEEHSREESRYVIYSRRVESAPLINRRVRAT